MLSESNDDIFESLRTSPSVDAWVSLTRLALGGDLDDAIDRYYGSVEDMIYTIRANSSGRVLAETTFDIGLEQVVATWDPAAVHTAKYIESMLRLITAFTPPSGFLKLFGFIANGGNFASFDSEIGGTETSVLEELEWNALRAYFPTAPDAPEKFPAFEGYTRLLVNELQTHKGRASACVRLLELGYFKPDGANFGELISEHAEQVVPALIDWLLGNERRDRDSLLASLYLQCQNSRSARLAFQGALERYEGTVELTDYRAQIIISDGLSISIPFAEESSYEMTKSKERQDLSDRGYDLLSQITWEEST